jgi:hypothetical protein
MAKGVQVPFITTAPGNFTLQHGLGTTPISVTKTLTSGGDVWFQTNRFDATNLYVVASDINVTGFFLVYAAADYEG